MSVGLLAFLPALATRSFIYLYVLYIMMHF